MRFLRSTILLASFVVTTLALYSFWWITSWFIPNKVYWRQAAFAAWTRSFALISGMRLEVNGERPKPPFFLVSNHLGYVDIAAIRLAVPGVFVAKGEIKSWFLAGKIVSDMGMIFIDRGNRRDIPRAGGEILERIEQGEGVIVFPEGTSTKGESVLPFNSSFLEFAAKSGLPVSYSAVTYHTPTGFPAASNYVCWWEDISFLSHMWRLFSLPGFTARVTFGKSPIASPDRKTLASDLHDRVESIFTPVV